MPYIFSPVYKDTFYESTGSTLSYYIVCDEEVIFTGKAYKGPNGNIRININKIAKDYLENRMDDFRLPYEELMLRHKDAFKYFDLYSDDGTLLASYGILFDWEGSFNGETKVLSDPIKPGVSPAMKLPLTVFSEYGDTFIVESVPSIHNTFFNLITTSLSIANEGGLYNVQWLTDYQPFTEIYVYSTAGAIRGGGNRSASGCTIDFAPAPSPAPRSFEVYIFYKDMSNILGMIEVLQSSIEFNLITDTLNVPSAGGVYTIRWSTPVDPVFITASAPDWPGTVISGISSTGCTVTIPENIFPDPYPFNISYYYTWSGTSYFIDSTAVRINGYRGATSGDTGDTTYSLIDSAVTRDVPFTQDGIFAGFGTPGIMIWSQVGTGLNAYYPKYREQYFQFMFKETLPRFTYLNNNISLCRKSKICEANSACTIDGYTLSGSTDWLNEYLETAKNQVCTGYTHSVTYTGDTTRFGIIYLLSGDTVMDSNTVMQPAHSWWNSYLHPNLPKVYLQDVSPYRFSDFKFKTTGMTQEEIRSAFTGQYVDGTSPNLNVHIWDGVKVYKGGTNEYYDNASLELVTDANGWTTVKTPLPLNKIDSLAGLPATEIWISRNVRHIDIYNASITGMTYEGTLQDFRNVWCSGSSIESVTCSDGLSYGIGTLCGKSDPLLYEGNSVRPSICNEYFYTTNDPTPSNTVTITFTGSTAVTTYNNASSRMYFRGINNEPLSVVSVVTGMTGDYAYATYTFDADVYWCTKVLSTWRGISDTIRYYNPSNSSWTGLAEFPTKMRVVKGGRMYQDNTNLPSTMEFTNLRALEGNYNFSGSTVTTLKVPNLITITNSALTHSEIEEVYAPSLQYIYGTPFPPTLEKLTLGKNLAGLSMSAFSNTPLLIDLYFNGSVAEWHKIKEIGNGFGGIYYSNIQTIYCDNGEIYVERE